MKSPKYILGSLKEKFDVTDEEMEGFPDMNYRVGNTSGMDRAPGVPSPMDERIGSLAQRGGGVMELLIENPATFQIDKERMFNVINQLDIDVSLHSDPDIGYTSAYRGSYDPTHTYFTRYLEQFAVFKNEAEIRAKESEEKEGHDFGFNIQRINPHISTSPLPALEESRAQDTGLDPFGFSLTEITESEFDEKDGEGKNIYRNQEFLKRLYKLFIVEEANYEYEFYSFLADFSDEFEDLWNKAQKEALNHYFLNETGSPGREELEDKIAVIRTAAGQDPGSETEWLNILEKEKLEEEINYTLDRPRQTPETGPANTLDDLRDIISVIGGGRTTLSQLRRLPESYHYFNQTESLDDIPDQIDLDFDKDFEEVKEIIKSSIESAVNELWKSKDEDAERVRYNISIEAQTAAINNRLEIPGRRITKRSYEAKQEKLENAAVKVFAGEEEYFESDDEKHGDYFRFFRNLINNFEREMWMESNIMYKIMPAWMEVANEEYEEDGKIAHKGWEAPEFLWEILVKQKWEEERGYDIDLKEPRGKEEDETGFLDLLENNREFQTDVAAASAACYVWGHFTQKKDRFKVKGEEYFEDTDAEMTWIKWMNEYGIGVNLEAMPGSPEQMYKIWRPKDIVAACRAVNITARKELDEIHPDLDEMPAKFTIDLEHTATFGIDPWKTMDGLIKQEKELADSKLAKRYEIEVDEDKPLARVLRTWHLMRAGLETSQSRTLHGPWDRGDTQLYRWLYKMVEAGFCRNPNEEGNIMYEVGGDDRGTTYTARIAMNMIEVGIDPEELDPSKVDPRKDKYDDEKEALMARFFGMDKTSYDREWAKIEEHAFDPLKGLIESDDFDYTWSGTAAIKRDVRPGEWQSEEYR